MSKLLEHLEIIEDWANEHHDSKEVWEHSIPIQEALERLESIDNANPSEALKYLEELRDYLLRDRVNISSTKNYNIINQTLIKAQEQEKELADVEMVKSGKTIIHIGKDLVMMNKAKYKEYVELENEPVSKRILQAKCEEQEKVLEIIKEKDVDMYSLRRCIAVDEYNTNFTIDEYQKLTEEEFELLRSILNE